MNDIPVFIIGDMVICNNALPLEGNNVAPPLQQGKGYVIRDTCLDSKNNLHIDVGLALEYNYVRSYETKEKLPTMITKENPAGIHWCHPSRFKRVELVKREDITDHFSKNYRYARNSKVIDPVSYQMLTPMEQADFYETIAPITHRLSLGRVRDPYDLSKLDNALIPV